jgi:hypothetical protein
MACSTGTFRCSSHVHGTLPLGTITEFLMLLMEYSQDHLHILLPAYTSLFTITLQHLTLCKEAILNVLGLHMSKADRFEM